MSNVQIISAADFREYSKNLNSTLKDNKPIGTMTSAQKQIRAEKLKKTQHLSKLFIKILEAEKVPVPVQELRFYPPRKWAFDFAWPEYKVALEVEGGVWTGGGHTRGKGFSKDIQKYNKATTLGWSVLRCVPDELKNQVTLLKTILINKNKS